MNEAIMLVLGGTVGIVGGMVGWFGQYWNGRFQREELFDHRLRIEKEYQIYSDLWETLFDFRLAAHGLVDAIQGRMEGDPWERYVIAFNAFQAVVCRNEPFISAQVLEPSQAIAKQGRAIANASEWIKDLDDRRLQLRDARADELVANKQIAEGHGQEEAIQAIDTLFPQVCDAIRTRVTRKLAGIGVGSSTTWPA